MPAHQRFHADHRAAARIQPGLIEHPQFAALYRIAQIPFQCDALARRRVAILLIPVVAGLMLIAGLVERRQRMLVQRLEVVAVFREQRDADVDAREQGRGAQFDRHGQRGDEARADAFNVVTTADAVERGGETVTVDKRCASILSDRQSVRIGQRDKQIAAAQLRAQAVRDFEHVLIVEVVAEGRGDLLLFAGIDHQISHLPVLALRKLQEQSQALAQEQLIRHAGQRVEVRHAIDALFIAPLLGNVLDGAQPARFAGDAVDDPFNALRDAPQFAVVVRALKLQRIRLRFRRSAVKNPFDDGPVGGAEQTAHSVHGFEIGRWVVGQQLPDALADAHLADIRVPFPVADTCAELRPAQSCLAAPQFVAQSSRALDVPQTVAQDLLHDGFDHEVRCAAFVREMNRFLVVQAREHDDRHVLTVGLRADVTARLIAVLSGHEHVQENQVKFVARVVRESDLAVRRFTHVVTIGAQPAGDYAAADFVIVRNQNAAFAGCCGGAREMWRGRQCQVIGGRRVRRGPGRHDVPAQCPQCGGQRVASSVRQLRHCCAVGVIIVADRFQFGQYVAELARPKGARRGFHSVRSGMQMGDALRRPGVT